VQSGNSLTYRCREPRLPNGMANELYYPKRINFWVSSAACCFCCVMLGLLCFLMSRFLVSSKMDSIEVLLLTMGVVALLIGCLACILPRVLRFCITPVTRDPVLRWSGVSRLFDPNREDRLGSLESLGANGTPSPLCQHCQRPNPPANIVCANSECKRVLSDRLTRFNMIVELQTSESDEEEMRCLICLGPFNSQSAVIALPCTHMFCARCIGEWLEKSVCCPGSDMRARAVHRMMVRGCRLPI
jgi:hypothetical protein